MGKSYANGSALASYGIKRAEARRPPAPNVAIYLLQSHGMPFLLSLYLYLYQPLPLPLYLFLCLPLAVPVFVSLYLY